jgi:hypothetical protein
MARTGFFPIQCKRVQMTASKGMKANYPARARWSGRVVVAGNRRDVHTRTLTMAASDSPVAVRE